MSLSSRIAMPGQIWSVAAPDTSGPLYVTSYGASPLETVVTVVDLSGSVAWQRTFAGTGRPPSRLSADGMLWVAYPDQAGRVLEGVLGDRRARGPAEAGPARRLRAGRGDPVAPGGVLRGGRPGRLGPRLRRRPARRDPRRAGRSRAGPGTRRRPRRPVDEPHRRRLAAAGKVVAADPAHSPRTRPAAPPLAAARQRARALARRPTVWWSQCSHTSGSRAGRPSGSC